MKRIAQKKYFTELISSRKDTKSIWKAINQLSGKQSASYTSSGTGLSPENINKHFCTIAEKIINVDLSKHNDLLLLKEFCDSKTIQSKLQLKYIGVHEVYKELCSLKQSSSRGLDELDGKILKTSAPIISEHITYIYNLY
mgnify:CR=1 FL=1